MWDLIHDKRKITIWERKISRNIYGSVYNDDLGIYEERHSKELYDLYEKCNTLAYIRCKRLKWLRHVWGTAMEMY